MHASMSSLPNVCVDIPYFLVYIKKNIFDRALGDSADVT